MTSFLRVGARLVHRLARHGDPPQSEGHGNRAFHRQFSLDHEEALCCSIVKLLAEMKSVAKDPNGYIFPGADGSFMDPDKFDAEILGAITTAAGMPGMRYHDLRHFFASKLIANRETAKYVCDQMGHSSIQVTFDRYGHLFPGEGREASNRLEESMNRVRADQSGRNFGRTDAAPEPGNKPEYPLN